MLRYFLLSVLLLISAGQVCAVSLLMVKGELTEQSPLLKSGEFHQVQKVTVEAGMLISFTVTAEKFPSYIVVNTPEDHSFSQGISGDEHQTKPDLVTIAAGEYTIAVTTDKPGQTGTFLLEAETQTLHGRSRGSEIFLDQCDELLDTDEDLGDGTTVSGRPMINL